MRKITYLLIVLFVFHPCLPAFSTKQQPNGVDKYVKQIKSKNRGSRWQSVEALAGSRNPAAKQALLKLLADKSVADKTRSIIVEAMHRYGKLDKTRLLSLLGDKGRETRSIAASIVSSQRSLFGNDIPACLNNSNLLLKTNAASILLNWRDARGVNPALEALNNSDDEVRFTAARSLQTVSNPDITAVMKTLLKDDKASIRAAAVRNLAILHDESLLETFSDLALNDMNADVRAAAVDALAKIGDASSVPVLVRVIKSDDIGDVAARALYEISDSEAIPAFMEALKDKDNDIRALAINCLIPFEDDNADDAIRNLMKEKNFAQKLDSLRFSDLPHMYYSEYVKELMSERLAEKALSQEECFDPPSFGDIDKAELINDLRNGNDEKQSDAIEAIKGMKDPAMIKPLLELLNDKSSKNQRNAAYVLGFMGDESVCPVLAEKTAKGGTIAIMAARAVQRLGHYELVSGYMIKMLDDKNKKLRTNAVVIIGDARDKAAFNALVSKLKNTDVDFKKAVIFALSRIDGPDAAKALLPVIKAPLQTKQWEPVQQFAFEAVSRMKEASIIMPDIINMLNSKDARVRSKAAWLLGKLKTPNAVDSLLATLQKENDKAVIQTIVVSLGEIGDERAVDALIEQADKEDAWQISACIALGHINCDTSYQYLLKMLNGPFVTNWRNASLGLAIMRKKDAADMLAARANMCPEAAIALANTGDPRAFEPLVHSLWNRDSYTDEQITALGELRDPRCADYIIANINRTDNFSATSVSSIAKIKSDQAIRCVFDALRWSFQWFPPVILTDVYMHEDEQRDDIRYFHLSSIAKLQEAIFPALVGCTGQDFGTDALKWINWRKSQKQNSNAQGASR